jgi:hypothetical protein
MSLLRSAVLVFALAIVAGGLTAAFGDQRYTAQDRLNMKLRIISGEPLSSGEIEAARAMEEQGLELPPFEPRKPVENEGGRGGRHSLDEYSWTETDYDWVDILAVGTRVTLCDDCNEGPFELGFSFTLWEETFTQMNICSNGWLSPTSTSNNLGGNSIPDGFDPNNAIYVFWDDLYPINGGGTWYYADDANDRFIVTWDNVPHFGSGEI